MLNKISIPLILCLISSTSLFSQEITGWPAQPVDTKPGTRWWWMGNAVDKENLSINIQKYAEAGIGTLEITPIYGVQGNDSREVPFLSAQWMDLYKYTLSEATRQGLQIDMNTGTGWPFGGSLVTSDMAACKLITRDYFLKAGGTLTIPVEVQDDKQKPYARLLKLLAFPEQGKCIDITPYVKGKILNWKAPEGNWHLIAAFCAPTFQQVKRAAPGGEGLVINHFQGKAVNSYLNNFTTAFENNKAPAPHNFFSDSYEVYEADFTPDFFEQFEKRRGYVLENYLPMFLSKIRNDSTARITSDYRETLSELLLENFTESWTKWSHQNGSQTRYQAHGSPGNLIDLYAAADVPECEGFGLSDFNIKGLRKDSLVRRNDADLSMMKYASSAAHIAGKPLVSSETFTWLTEHFRTSFSQCKPDLDLLFTSGVNHVYFHGTTYSPAEAAWPGWKFYASVDMSPTNPLWRDAAPFFNYITRVQSFLQLGKPDNDFLVYLPVYDMWHEQSGRLLMFDIHGMAERAPGFINIVSSIYNAGYDMDYISDSFIRSATCSGGRIITSGGSYYKALIIPAAKKMPADVLSKLVQLADKGATIVFVNNYPEDVPGFAKLENRRKTLHKILQKLPHTEFRICSIAKTGKGSIITGMDKDSLLQLTGAACETMKPEFDLHMIRRKTDDIGFHYFISALKSTDTDGWITLGVPAISAMFFDPLTGNRGKATLRQLNGKTQVKLQLASGASIILKTFTHVDVDFPTWKYVEETHVPVELSHNWLLWFSNSIPAIRDTFDLKNLCPWTALDLPAARINTGTANYFKTFEINKDLYDDWILDLGDVRETARIKINGKYAATLWAVPYRIAVGSFLQNGHNTIEIEVTGLAANHIAEMDRQGIKWRIFKEINMVDIHYKNSTYANWQTLPCGLNSRVQLIPVNYSGGKRE